jgi:hypothetical protein
MTPAMYDILVQEAKDCFMVHDEMKRQFKKQPHNRVLQSDLETSKIYVSAYLTLLNSGRKKKWNHLPKDYTLMRMVTSTSSLLLEKISIRAAVKEHAKVLVRV